MKIVRLSVLLSMMAMAVFSLSSFLPYGGGAPSPYYYTGSPGDAHSCAQCHGSASTVTGWVTSNIPGSGYIPGTVYQITCTNSVSGSGKYGFECSPQSPTGLLLGTLAAGTGNKLVGSGKWVTHSNASNSVTSWTFNWTAPAAGTGTVTFYASFARGTGSPTKLSTLLVNEGASPPAAAGPISGPATVCLGSTVSYSVGTISGATSYVWSVPAGASIVSGSGTTSISVNFGAGASSGNVSVYGSNTAGNGTPSNLAVSVITLPAPASAITGLTTPCQGSNQEYFVVNSSGVTFTWTVPSGSTIASGQGTNVLHVILGPNSGNIEVVPSNLCGSGTGSSLPVTVSPLPAQPGSINGPGSACSGSNVTFSVGNVSGITYTWFVPSGCVITSGQGTNTIDVTVGSASGNVEVVPSNSCGNGPGRSLPLTVNSAPVQPAPISGLSTPCEGTEQVYSVDYVAGCTYNWIVPSSYTITGGTGTNTIHVMVGVIAGNIEVIAANSCGTSPGQSMMITPQSLPGAAASITGLTTIPSPVTISTTYTTTGATGAIYYVWELTPPEAGTVAGDGLTSTVTWNSEFLGIAWIRVKGINGCGEGAWSEMLEIQVLSVGIDDPESRVFEIFPSPNTGNFTISLTLNDAFVEAFIIDAVGKVVHKEKIPGKGISTMNLSLSPGIYTLRIESNSRRTEKKIIVG
jgi:hypothetical protein